MISTLSEAITVRALRRATEMVDPTMLSTMARSVVIRDSTSPVRTVRK